MRPGIFVGCFVPSPDGLFLLLVAGTSALELFFQCWRVCDVPLLVPECLFKDLAGAYACTIVLYCFLCLLLLSCPQQSLFFSVCLTCSVLIFLCVIACLDVRCTCIGGWIYQWPSGSFTEGLRGGSTLSCSLPRHWGLQTRIHRGSCPACGLAA